ncbi:MAG: hypothetical protein ACI9D5_000057 [Candidatus Endobugula sp.]|jgi:hypothetical protein
MIIELIASQQVDRKASVLKIGCWEITPIADGETSPNSTHQTPRTAQAPSSRAPLPDKSVETTCDNAAHQESSTILDINNIHLISP